MKHANPYLAMAASAASRRLLGDAFVTGYCAVKALEYDSYLNEISAWERRFFVAAGVSSTEDRGARNRIELEGN